MGVTRKVIEEGTGTEKPQKGDEATVEYTGNLYDAEVGPEKDYRGKTYVYCTSRWPFNLSERKPADQYFYTSRFDSSIGRGDFKTQIGVGKVIRGASDLYTPEDVAIDGYNLGWDEGVMEMVVGEKSILTVSGYASTSTPASRISSTSLPSLTPLTYPKQQ